MDEYSKDYPKMIEWGFVDKDGDLCLKLKGDEDPHVVTNGDWKAVVGVGAAIAEGYANSQK